MANANYILESVLRECRAKDPAPFYPSIDAKDKGLNRADIDKALDELRLGGLIQLTPWEAGRGQGYTLTPEGEQVLQSPRALSRLQTHGVEAKRQEAPAANDSDGKMMTPWERGETTRRILFHGIAPVVTLTLILL